MVGGGRFFNTSAEILEMPMESIVKIFKCRPVPISSERLQVDFAVYSMLDLRMNFGMI